VVALLASFAMLYIFRDIVDEFTTWVDFALAAMGGRSGRPQLLLEKYDVFYLAPYGIYLAFMGPTFQEMSIGVLHVFTFFESLIIVVILTLFMVRRLPDRPVFNLILSFGGLFWILFANYPLGLSNPGTAIRYRTGYILIVFLCAVTLQSRPLYADWVKGWRQRSGRRLLSIVWSSRKAPST
jgi:hypothetical protein